MAEETNGAGSEPEVAELYDHSIRKPERAGLALLASFFFFGGGQLVKGHFARFFGLWGIVVGLCGLAIVSGAALGRESTAALVIGRACVVGLVLTWCYQLWDAATRV